MANMYSNFSLSSLPCRPDGDRLARVRASFLACKRNEIERFERFITDWEFREYAYHL
jgi:hypothetical protein